MAKITNAKEARAAIGKRVKWEEHSARYVFERSGTIDEVSGRNIRIDGNWSWRADLTNLRSDDE